MDTAALRAYRALVEAEGFAEWFARVSPLREIGAMRIGSRPARRGIAPTTGLDRSFAGFDADRASGLGG